MRVLYRDGSHVHAVELTDLGGGKRRVRWSRHAQGEDGRPGEVIEERELELDVTTTPAGYAVMAGSDVHVARVERRGQERVVTIGGASLALERVDPFEAAGRRGNAAASGPRTIASPMPGRVVAVQVAVGDEVAEGATVAVVEAMKMANEMRAPITGRVTHVRAKVGDAVESGTALVVIAPR